MIRFAPLLSLALLACSGPPERNTTNAVEEQRQVDAPVRDVETLPPDETALVDTGNGTVGTVPASTKIPERLHGRWGMVPADCDPARDDNKGLMTVTTDTLRFYESRGTVATVTRADPDRFSGTFSFKGEGQEWTADVTLTRDEDTLSRQEGGQRFAYKRCA